MKVKLKTIAKQNGFEVDEFENFLWKTGKIELSGGFNTSIDEENVAWAVNAYKQSLNPQNAEAINVNNKEDANCKNDDMPTPAEPPCPAVRHTAPSGWISLLKTITMIWMVGGILGSVIYGFILMIQTRTTILGVLILVVGCIVALVSAAAVMVFLDMAADVRKIRGMLEKK